MRILIMILAGAILTLSFGSAVQAQNLPVAASEYTADEIAENQGAVAYWYAWGYNYAFGDFPVTFAQMQAHGLPLRSFRSPHTGDEINFDDRSLDFDGDMTYAVTGSNVEIQIQTTHGVVILPGTLSRENECGDMLCCEIGICKDKCWKVCDDNDAACKILQWMMWLSFETHECRYGYRPVDEQAWIASGFAPVAANWRESAPYMDIKLIASKCELKKARVICCQPCVKAQPCAAVQPCATRTPKCKQNTCSTCKPKAESKCNQCKQSTCSTCKPKSVSKCDSSQPTACATAKPKCSKCKQNTCSTCKPKVELKCNQCKQNTCGSCKPKCEPTCKKCKQATCTASKPQCAPKCGSEAIPYVEAPASTPACACDAWVPFEGNELVESLRISVTASESTAGPLELQLRNAMNRQVALIELPGPITGDYTYTYTLATPVNASDLVAAVLISDSTDPATLSSFRVVGMDGEYFSYVYVDHTCPGAVIGPGGCTRMEIN